MHAGYFAQLRKRSTSSLRLLFGYRLPFGLSKRFKYINRCLVFAFPKHKYRESLGNVMKMIIIIIYT